MACRPQGAAGDEDGLGAPMVSISSRELVKAFALLVVSLVVASMLALFSGVFYEPEIAAAHRERARQVLPLEDVLSQEELDRTTVPISEISYPRSNYTLQDDAVAGFRQSGPWFFAVHLALLAIFRPRLTEAAAVSVVALCLLVLVVPWPNPSLAIAFSAIVYALLAWLKPKKITEAS